MFLEARVEFGQEFVLVSAIVDEFCFGVEGGQFWFAQNNVLFCGAEVASFGAVVVWGGMAEDFPSDVEVSLLFFQNPDVFAQFCLALVFWVVYRLFVVAISGLEGGFSDSYIRVFFFLGFDCGLVDDVLFQALVLEWTVSPVSAVAFFVLYGGAFSVVVLGLFLQFFLVCRVDGGFDIRHA